MTDPSQDQGSNNVIPLNQVLASILRDVDKAQNTSNVFSAKLSRYYKSHQTLHNFPVPNGSIDEVDIGLKMAIDGVDLPGPAKEDQIGQAMDIFKNAAELIAEHLAESMQEKMGPAGNEELQSQVGQMLKTAQGSVFQDKLKDRIFGGLNQSLESLISRGQGLDFNATCDKATDIVEAIVLSNDAVQAALDAGSLSEDDLHTMVQNLVRDVLQFAVGAVGAFELWDSPNLNVIINTNALADVPESLLTTCQVKVKQRSYKWVLNANIQPNSQDPNIDAGVLERVD